MLEITHVKVYDLYESVIASGNAMRTHPVGYTDEEFQRGLKRMARLCRASRSSDVRCHDNALTGIRVSFDLKYTQYITKQLQRYHWFDYVSSSSLMHRITQMDFNECTNKYVRPEIKELMNRLIAEYNDMSEEESERKYQKYMEIISNCPMGAELFVRISTNYKQLQTMYFQRKNHKLKEDWGVFCKFVESLPHFKELILGQDSEDRK